MPFPGDRKLRALMAGSLLALAACAESAEGPNSMIPGPVTGDGDWSAGDGDGDWTVGDGDGDGIDPDDNQGGQKPDGGLPGDAGSWVGDDGKCDGIAIGKRCVKPEHLEVIPASPQPTDPDAPLVHDFEKSYNNIGKLKANMIPPSADLGEWYMNNGDFVRIGVAYKSYQATGGKVADKDRQPQRDGRNKDLTWPLNAVKGIDGSDIAAPNCLVCHGEYFNKKLVVGLGRNKHFIAVDASGFSLDVVGIAINSIFQLDSFSQLGNALGLLTRLFPDTMHSHLFDLFAALGMRHDPKTLKWTGRLAGNPNSKMKGWIDFPAWWNVKKKNALYSSGSGRGYKSDHMLYMNWFSLDGIEEAKEVVNNFKHAQKWLEERVKAPKFEDFGGKIDRALAERGEEVYLVACAHCHGTYSDDESEEFYPNLLVDLAEVGTDPNLAKNHWIYPVSPWYDNSWYATLKTPTGERTSTIVRVNGYMAPPLDGVFITAPYFHNGSVPTLEGVLDPTKRPALWTSNKSPDDYDWEKVGWKNKDFDTTFWTLDQRQGAYFTSDPGNSNKGHDYGAALTPDERKAVLEYLKTL